MSHQKRFYVQANGVKLHFLEFGFTGPPLLILPGISTTAANLDFVAEALAPFAHVFVMENRGRGLSDQRSGLTYTLDDYAADANGLLECLGITSAIVLGHSMGGRVGIRMAVNYPERINSLIVVDAPLSRPGRPYAMPVDLYLEAIREAKQGVRQEAKPAWASRWSQKQLNDRMKWLPTCSEESIIASHRGLGEEGIHMDLSSVGCQTLMLFADEGITVPNEHIDELLNTLNNPNICIRQMTDVGHMIPWDDLDQFVSLVSEFIVKNSVA